MGNPTDVPWHSPKLSTLDPGTRELLEKYSGIEPDQVLPHIEAIRDRAWDVHPYPCIGQYRFTDLSLGRAPQYDEVLRRAKAGERVLDVGCCFAQDTRRLVYDGVSAENLHGTDLVPEFLDLGYDLFRDRESLKAHIFAADIFKDDAELKALDGTVDIIHASSFFHLFELEPQVEIVRRFVRLLKPAKGSMVLGRHMGNEVGGRYPQLRTDGFMYWHDHASFKKMWDDVGAETGTKWRVDVQWDTRTEASRAEVSRTDASRNGLNWQHRGSRLTRYAVWRE